jgi:hypothetical protein
LKYQEEYKLALESFSCAHALDPTWEVPQQSEKQLVKYLDSVQELASLKGKLKGKKLRQMVQVKFDHISIKYWLGGSPCHNMMAHPQVADGAEGLLHL